MKTIEELYNELKKHKELLAEATDSCDEKAKRKFFDAVYDDLAAIEKWENENIYLRRGL